MFLFPHLGGGELPDFDVDVVLQVNSCTYGQKSANVTELPTRERSLRSTPSMRMKFWKKN